MKGLILNCLGRKEEAYENVRKGLTNDLKSHVCWHVYGLLQRSDKKYNEAIKAYRNALKWDKDNMQILRDLSLLQIQMRDLEGYKDTRHQLFSLRPTHRASWIGFAMSYHLLKDYDMALKILEEFRKTQKKTGYDYEYSELLMYQNMVHKESGNIAAALDHLNQYESSICDKISLKETRGKYLIELQRLEEAASVYQDLLNRNPENHEYYQQLEVARNLDTEEAKLAMYEDYQTKFPRAAAPKRLPLNFLTGDLFDKHLNKYVTAAIRKGVPPLFVDVKPLYANPIKRKQIETLFDRLLNNLTQYSSFEDDGKSKESPTCLLWTYYYLAQQCNYFGEFARALELINKAIDHTPTLIELFMLKGKIYKHAGDPDKAVECFDEAQSMDTADRYINCKCAKYMLRANKIKEAEAMCAKFTREGVPAMENLNEMQCMWFQTECARAFQRTGQLGEALKKCYEIDRHFTEIIEDQFDFHTYCMRKMTLKAYVTLLRLEDDLRSHKFYQEAAEVAIQTLVNLHDRPLKDIGNSLENYSDDIDPSELKKRQNKAKKAKRKAEQEKALKSQETKKKEAHNKSKRKGEDDCENQVKEELIPDKLARTETPLDEATKFLEPLLLLANNSIKTHLLAFEVYLRKGKVLQMLQAIKKASSLDAKNVRLHSCFVRFLQYQESNRGNLNANVIKVIDLSIPELIKNVTASEYNNKFLALTENSDKLELLSLAYGLSLQVSLDPSSSAQVVAKLTNTSIVGQKLDDCRYVLKALEDGQFGEEGAAAAPAFKLKCSVELPLARCFMSPDQLGNNQNNQDQCVEALAEEMEDSLAIKEDVKNAAQ